VIICCNAPLHVAHHYGSKTLIFLARMETIDFGLTKTRSKLKAVVERFKLSRDKADIHGSPHRSNLGSLPGPLAAQLDQVRFGRSRLSTGLRISNSPPATTQFDEIVQISSYYSGADCRSLFHMLLYVTVG